MSGGGFRPPGAPGDPSGGAGPWAPGPVPPGNPPGFQHGYPPTPAPPRLAVPDAIQERNSAVVILLGIVTCGFYLLYWIYKTSDELRVALDDPTINPPLDLLLTLVSCGIWGIFVEHRNISKTYAVLLPLEPHRQDQSQTVLILNLAAFVVGLTNLVATYLVQEELNALARASRGAFNR